MIYVTDTHPLVWWLDPSQNRRIRPLVRQIFQDETLKLVVPAVVLAEIVFLRASGRIFVSLADALAYVRRIPNRIVHPFDARVALHLPDTLNIHGAMIVATAPVYQEESDEEVTVITKDGMIVSSGLVSVLW